MLAGEPTGNTFNVSRLAYHGTAFAITPGIFITAGHVLDTARTGGRIALARFGSSTVRVHEVNEYDIFPEVDIGIARCTLEVQILPVSFRTLNFAEPVGLAGYMLGPEPEFQTVFPRVFTGTIVTRRRLFRVGGRDLAGQPPGYELSFGVPGGLSGAPLISMIDEAVSAIAVGTMTEAQDDVVKQLGVAIDIEELLRLQSAAFGPIARLFGRESLPAREPMRRIVTGPDGRRRHEGESNVDPDSWPDD